MGKIQLLDNKLADKIAAGEVVERPASVVKELIENSLDANASSIQVDIEEGGLKKIQVIDDGDGFEPDDCQLAFERHATSKIQNERDLFQIRTLGFRGEALPSIASVSHMELITGTGEGSGKKIVLQGGHLIQSQSSSSFKGSKITVSQLFYNTPARLKHLKTVHTELGKITDVLNKMALAHPSVRFLLTHNDKTLFKTNGHGDLAQVLAAVYGIQTAKTSIGFTDENADFKISGRLVKPTVTRAGRQYIYIFINNRFIKSYPLFKAIMNGYHTLLPIGRYPIAVLHIDLDPTLIDVNVHPAKLEARISKEQELCQLVETAIKQAFHEQRLIPEAKPRREREKSTQTQMMFNERRPVSNSDNTNSVSADPGKAAASVNQKEDHSWPEQVKEGAPFAKSQLNQEEQGMDGKEETTSEGLTVSDTNFIQEDSDDGTFGEKRLPELHPIGQFHGTYILAQNDEGLYIIDQHAAQERIKYEFYRDQLAVPKHDMQELLFPLTLELNTAEMRIVEEHQAELEAIGLHLAPFGSQAYVVNAHPNWFPAGEERQTIEAIIEQLISEQQVSLKKLREDAAILMSCKRSIKANRFLREDEIHALLDSLNQASDPFTCPHGRPVFIHFSEYEMKKMFKRVM